MRRTSSFSLACTAALTAAAVLALAVSSALATPTPNSAVVKERVFNDCATSTVTSVDNYPALVSIQDALNCNTGFANLHNWRFSDDDVTQLQFPNGSSFSFAADVTLSGTGEGEGGLSLAPWWSPDVDGRFNCRTTDGEIACFGGRLPFYSFTGSQGLTYVKGTPIHLEIVYRPHALNQVAPATIEYKIFYNATNYTSGELPFDKGNPAEDPPYGLWGMLNKARAGGYVQCFVNNPSQNVTLLAQWANIQFAQPSGKVPASTPWGLAFLALAMVGAAAFWGFRRRTAAA